MKKFTYIILVFAMIFSFNFNVEASSGGLKKDSIKTCPDGVTYGCHGKDNHWHVAENKGSWSNWSAVGDPLPGDPCPDVNSHNIQNSTENEVASVNEMPVVSNKQVSNNSSNNNSNTINKESTTQMATETKTTEVIIETTTTSTTSKNKIEPKLEKLYINTSEITFNSLNRGSTTKLFDTNKITIGYTLSSNDYVLKVYDKDNNEITNIDNISIKNGNNDYKLVVMDDEGNSKEYYLNIYKCTLLGTVFIIIIFVVIFVALPIILIKFIINKIKKKR